MSGWSHRYVGFDPEKEGLREALCTLGNGYFATRGAGEETKADGVHYPGTYLAGGYNRATTRIAGREIENEDLVNLPNWLPLTFRIDGGAWFDLSGVEILDYEQVLHLDSAELRRTVRFRDREGRVTRVESRRFVHMRDPNLAGIRTMITAESWSGRMDVRSALDGRVVNAGVERYSALESRHLEPLETGRVGREGIRLVAQTRQSKIRIALAARTRVRRDPARGSGSLPVTFREIRREPGFIAEDFSVTIDRGDRVVVEKIIALHTSRDRAIADPDLSASEAVARAPDFETLVASHREEWKHLWRRADILLEETSQSAEPQVILRLHVFHLLQTVSLHTSELDAGVPARGWHGEAYRGHIFWDELFILPFLNLRFPQISRALLEYRYRRLGEARRLARSEGFPGALFPWQSGSDGREETQVIHLNPESGRWLPDHTRLQRHVNAAIAYNVWLYYQTTGDLEFLSFHGAELILEIARFWAGAATWNVELERWEILGVIGPDEFHDAYPDADEPGLDNNSYTNLMAVWVLRCALEVVELLDGSRRDAILERLKLEEREIELWEDISRRMRLVIHEDGILTAFEGYEALEELDWDAYRERYGDIHRLDRILEAEEDSANRYKASKQADVLMLFYLFSSEELAELFERLGYPFDPADIPRTIQYYGARTSDGSTLSRVVHAWILARLDRKQSWEIFCEALRSDVEDIQGGTTAEGIHLGAMAGTVDLVQRGHTGIATRDDTLWFDPALPEPMGALELTLHYRGVDLDLRIDDSVLTIDSRPAIRASGQTPILIGVRGEVRELSPGESLRVDL
jgi:alpha,alpha-trehalase